MVDWVYKPIVSVFKFWDAEKTGTSEQPFKILIQRKRAFQAFQKNPWSFDAEKKDISKESLKFLTH